MRARGAGGGGGAEGRQAGGGGLRGGGEGDGDGGLGGGGLGGGGVEGDTCGSGVGRGHGSGHRPATVAVVRVAATGAVGLVWHRTVKSAGSLPAVVQLRWQAVADRSRESTARNARARTMAVAGVRAAATGAWAAGEGVGIDGGREAGL